jgi:hypothetical protein
MRLYIEEGIIPGSFLEAVIQNNLIESFSRADSLNIERMFYIARFVYAEMPRQAWGSKEIMENWSNAGGLNGLYKNK